MEQLSTEFFGEEFGPEIDLKDGQIIRPFQYKTEFLPADLGQNLHQDGRTIVLCSRFNNRGLRGVFAAYTAYEQSNIPDQGLIPETTPLGKPRDFHFDWKDGLRVPVNPPLSLAMVYHLRTAHDLNLLTRYYYEFAVGDDTYFMNNETCNFSVPSLFVDGALYNEDSARVSPVLPYSLEALAEVRVSAISDGQPTRFDIRRIGQFEYAIVPMP